MQLVGQELVGKAPIEVHDGVERDGAADENGHGKQSLSKMAVMKAFHTFRLPVNDKSSIKPNPSALPSVKFFVLLLTTSLKLSASRKLKLSHLRKVCLPILTSSLITNTYTLFSGLFSI